MRSSFPGHPGALWSTSRHHLCDIPKNQLSKFHPKVRESNTQIITVYTWNSEKQILEITGLPTYNLILLITTPPPFCFLSYGTLGSFVVAKMQSSDPMPWSVASEPLRSYFHLEFGTEAVSLMVHLLYLCAYQFTRLIVRKTSSFFTLFNVVCISGALRSLFWISVVLFNHFNTEKVPSMGRSLILQFSLYMDIWEDQFWQCMLFLITCNSLISQRNSYSITRKYCTTVSVLLFVLLSSFFSLFMIYESHMTRMYVQNIGAIDIADPSSEAIPNINRLFYIFTIGSFICCIFHFFLVSRQQKNKTIPIGTSFVREHGIFVPLTITNLLNSLCCLGLEYINHVDFNGNQAKRIVLVRVLSCANTIAKLSLPLMILVSNCFYQQKEEDPKSVEFEMA